MVRIHTTISMDEDIRNKAKEILKEKGMNLSFYIEQVFRKLISKEGYEIVSEDNCKEVNK